MYAPGVYRLDSFFKIDAAYEKACPGCFLARASFPKPDRALILTKPSFIFSALVRIFYFCSAGKGMDP